MTAVRAVDALAQRFVGRGSSIPWVTDEDCRRSFERAYGRPLRVRLETVPDEWAEPVAETWWKKFDAGATDGAGARAANSWLREWAEGAAGELPLDADDWQIRGKADEQARRFRGRRWTPTEDEIEELGAKTLEGARARVRDPCFWRRRLRKAHGQRVERAGIGAGLVRGCGQLYVTDASVRRREGQKRRNRALLEELQATNEVGDTYTLAELAELSVSNPALRRGELMTRLFGMEWVADTVGHVGYFLTFTTPSAYHPTRTYGRGKDKRIVDNPRYEGYSPKEGQDWLAEMWGRLRAALHREGLEWWGFRVVEPHGDGTPHWHVLVYLDKRDVGRMIELARRYALQDRGDEKNARRRRFNYLKIDRRRGSGTSYLAKYISKNIDGAGIDPFDVAAPAETYGRDPVALSQRVEAWASTWRIRQFQQVGGPSVSVWRELRRMDWEESGLVETARAAADEGDWAAFQRLASEYEPIRLARLEAFGEETGELPLNRYGEPAAAAVIGVEHEGEIYVTRLHQWTIDRVPREAEAEQGNFGIRADTTSMAELCRRYALEQWHFDIPAGMTLRGRWEVPDSTAERPPWSSVNNCTRPEGATSDRIPDTSSSRNFSGEKGSDDAQGGCNRANGRSAAGNKCRAGPRSGDAAAARIPLRASRGGRDP